MSGILNIAFFFLVTLFINSNAQRVRMDCSPPLIYDRNSSTCLDFTKVSKTASTLEEAASQCAPGFGPVSVENPYKMAILYDLFMGWYTGDGMPTTFWTSGKRAGPDQEFYWHYPDNHTMGFGDYTPFAVTPIAGDNYVGVYFGQNPKTFLPLKHDDNKLPLGIICEATICPPPPCKSSPSSPVETRCVEDFTDAGCKVCSKCQNDHCKMKIVDDGRGILCTQCECGNGGLCWNNTTMTSEPVLKPDGSVEKCDGTGMMTCSEPAQCQKSTNTCCLYTDLKCDTSKSCGYDCVYVQGPGNTCPVCQCSEFSFPIIFKLSISNGAAVDPDTLADEICTNIEFSTSSTDCPAIANTCNVYEGNFFGMNDAEYRAMVEFNVMVTYDKIREKVEKCRNIVPNLIARDANKNLGIVKATIKFDKNFEPSMSQLNKAPCLKSREPKSCSKGKSYSIRYEYNSREGTCSPFEYDGCETDTVNAFKSRRECEQTCAQDRCYLPVQPGPCKALFQRWTYNIDTGKCQQFNYGGCDGNANNFETEADCREICEPVRCRMPQDEGSTACYGHSELRRWYHLKNDYIHECREGTYTGCLGNSNRFLSKEECQQTCMPELFTTPTTTTTELPPGMEGQAGQPKHSDQEETKEFEPMTKTSGPRDVTENPGQPITESHTSKEIPGLQNGEFLVGEDETSDPQYSSSTHRPDVPGTEQSEIPDLQEGELLLGEETLEPREPTDQPEPITFEPEGDEPTESPLKPTEDHENPEPGNPTTKKPGGDKEVTDDDKGVTDDSFTDFTIISKIMTRPTNMRTTSRLTTKFTGPQSSTVPPLTNPTSLYRADEHYCTCTLSGDPIIETFDGLIAAVEGQGKYLISQHIDLENNPQRTFKLIIELIQSDPKDFPSILTTGKVTLNLFTDISLSFTATTVEMHRTNSETMLNLPYQDFNMLIRGDPKALVWLTTFNNISLVVDRTDLDNVQVTLAIPRDLPVPGQLEGFCIDCNGYPENDCFLYPPVNGAGSGVPEKPAVEVTEPAVEEVTISPGHEGGVRDVCRLDDKYILMSDHYRLK